MSDEKDKTVFIGTIGHKDSGKKTLASAIAERLKQKGDKDFLGYIDQREKFNRSMEYGNISTVGRNSNEEIKPTTDAALQNLTMTREYLESLKQLGVIQIRRDCLSITGIYDEAQSIKLK